MDGMMLTEKHYSLLVLSWIGSLVVVGVGDVDGAGVTRIDVRKSASRPRPILAASMHTYDVRPQILKERVGGRARVRGESTVLECEVTACGASWYNRVRTLNSCMMIVRPCLHTVITGR